MTLPWDSIFLIELFDSTSSLSWVNCQDCRELTTSLVHPAGPPSLTRQLSENVCWMASDKTFLAGDWRGKKKIKNRIERRRKGDISFHWFLCQWEVFKNHFLAAALRCVSCYAEGGRKKNKLWIRSICDFSFMWTGSPLGKQKIRNSNKRQSDCLREQWLWAELWDWQSLTSESSSAPFSPWSLPHSESSLS